MDSDKLFIEVMQNIQDLISLFEKAIALESKLYAHYRALAREEIPTELRSVLETQNVQLYNTFKRLEGAMNE